MSFFKGSKEAREKIKDRVRKAGLEAERTFFGAGGVMSHAEALKAAEGIVAHERASAHLNPVTEADFMGRKGWVLEKGTRRMPKVFRRNFGHTLQQVIQREARAWRLLEKTFISPEFLSKGEYPLLSDASIIADKQARELGALNENPGKKSAWSIGMERMEYSGSGIIGTDDPLYTHREKLPKYNVAVSPLSAHGKDGVKMLIRRLPNFTKAMHKKHSAAHAEIAARLNEFYQDLIRDEEARLKQRGIDPGPLVSGIVSYEFPDNVKDTLRDYARRITENKTVAMLHDEASKSRTVKENPLAIYGGFNPPKDNPPRSIRANVEGVVYNRCLEIRGEKTQFMPGLYRHPFKKGSKVQILALDNGDLLIRAQNGKRLWMKD